MGVSRRKKSSTSSRVTFDTPDLKELNFSCIFLFSSPILELAGLEDKIDNDTGSFVSGDDTSASEEGTETGT